MATQYITRMKITTIVQNDVTYVLSDEPVKESGIDYVYDRPCVGKSAAVSP